MKQIQVAYIINDEKLVLNVGSNDGISEGQEFLIYGLSEDDIIDPATGLSLGRLELVRGTGIVDYIQDKICIIKTNTLKKAPTFSISQALTGEVHYIPFDSPRVGDYAREILSNLEENI